MMRFSPNGSPNALVFSDVMEIRKVSPQQNNFLQLAYPHSGIWKARENEYAHCKQTAGSLFIHLKPNRHKNGQILQFLSVHTCWSQPRL